MTPIARRWTRRLVAPSLLLVTFAALAAAPSHAGGLPELFPALPWSAAGTDSMSGFGFSAHTAGDIDGDGFGDLLVGAQTEDDSLSLEGAAYLFRGSAEGTSLTPAWVWHGRQIEAFAGFTLAAAGDVNGDGFGDVAIGVPFWDTPSHMNTGKIAIFHGGANGLPLAPNYELVSPTPTSEHRFGFRLAPAGDVNADGFADLLVTGILPGPSGNRGVVFVFHGSATGLAAAPARTWLGPLLSQGTDFGFGLSSAGDVNGDGFADVLVGAPTHITPLAVGGATYLYLGSASGASADPDTVIAGTQNNARCGDSVSLVGDVNGDGHGDVIFGCPGQDAFAGRATLAFGGPTGIVSTITVPVPGSMPNETIGRFVATLGDLDGDGFGDFGVSSRDQAGTNRGRISVFRGARAGIEFLGDLGTPASDGFFGVCFGTTGDANGDGLAEIFVGSEDMSVVPGALEGRAFQYRLARAGLRRAFGWPRLGSQAGTRYGASVAIVPQFDGHDLPYMIVGDPMYDGVGRVMLHRGSNLIGVTFDIDRDQVGTTNFQSLGARLVDVGDMDGNGRGDYVVSSTTRDNGAISQAGRVDFHGGTTGTIGPGTLVVAGTHAFDRVGSALAGRGDVNGDGFHDLVVGAREWDEPGLGDCGKVFVFFGSATGPAVATPWTRLGSVGGQGFGAGVALTDLDADGYTDVVVGSSAPGFGATAPGKVEVFYGGAGGPANEPGLVLNPPVPHVSFGAVVTALGDINADGIADLGVAAPSQDDRGVVRIYEGTLGRSQNQVPIRTLTGSLTGRFGEAMTGGGDVDGDGLGDFVIGEPGWDGGQTDEGRIHLFYGAPFAPANTAAQLIESNVLSAEFGASLSPMRDLNLDAFADVIVGAPGAAGRVYPYFGGNGFGRWLQFEPDEGVPNRYHPARTGVADQFLGHLYMNTAGGGRARIRYQLEIRTHNEVFTGVPTHDIPFLFDPGPPGSQFFTGVGAEIDPSLPGRGLHARARWLTPSPFFPRTRWVTPEAHTSGDHDLWATGTVVGVPGGGPGTGGGLRIESVSPNPSLGRSGPSRIAFHLPREGRVTVDVFDLRGARIRRLIDETRPVGRSDASWDGLDDQGRTSAAGVYFAVLRADDKVARMKFVRL